MQIRKVQKPSRREQCGHASAEKNELMLGFAGGRRGGGSGGGGSNVTSKFMKVTRSIR